MEIVADHILEYDGVRLRVISANRRDVIERNSGERGEDMIVVAEMLIARPFHIDIDAILARTFLYEFDELIGPLNGHLAEHDGIDQAEDGGICADAQRQRDDGNQRKA